MTNELFFRKKEKQDKKKFDFSSFDINFYNKRKPEVNLHS